MVQYAKRGKNKLNPPMKNKEFAKALYLDTGCNNGPLNLQMHDFLAILAPPLQLEVIRRMESKGIQIGISSNIYKESKWGYRKTHDPLPNSLMSSSTSTSILYS